MLPLQATTVLWRVIPMGFLFLVRVSVTATRWHLGSGSKEATWHYIMMEVRSRMGCGCFPSMRLNANLFGTAVTDETLRVLCTPGFA